MFCPEWKHPSTWLNQKCWEDEVNLRIIQKKGKDLTAYREFIDEGNEE